MKQKLFMGIILGMSFQSAITFGQSTGPHYNNTGEVQKAAKTYLDIMVNVVATDINYGGANSALVDYKKPAKGIQAGVSFQAGITPAFSLVSELYFIRKSGELKANNPLTANGSTLRLNTLELPVLARFHMGKFYLNAGPSIAYNLSGNQKIGEQTSKLVFANSNEGFKRLDAGIQMGGGIEFPFKQKRISLDIRYNYGLINVSNDSEIRNRALMVSVHFSKAWHKNPLGRK